MNLQSLASSTRNFQITSCSDLKYDAEVTCRELLELNTANLYQSLDEHGLMHDIKVKEGSSLLQ